MSFIYKEILPKELLKKLPKEFSLNQEKFYKEVALIRILSGTANIECPHENKTILTRKDYSNAKGKENQRIRDTSVVRCIKPFQPKIFAKYLNTNRSNNRLIEDLLFEFSYYYLYTEKGNHTSSFIHLYRIMEFISYSFPLIHASTSKNFHGTFSSLQSYFTKEGGEFEFIKKFILKLFEGDQILEFGFEFQVKAPTVIIQKKIYQEYKKIFDSSNVQFDDANLKVTMKAKDIIENTRFLRNRYFHFAIGSGQKNIKASEILYPDMFFEQINPLIANWLSIIYFELMLNLADKWTKK